jgi:hypothetical protein
MSRLMHAFFSAWDEVETMHPFGVQWFAPLFSEFGITGQLCTHVDGFLYLDLMVPVHINTRRIKIEDRRSSRVLWAYVELLHSSVLVGFQRLPSEPFEYLTFVNAQPLELIFLIVSYFFRSPNTVECDRRIHLHGGRPRRAD